MRHKELTWDGYDIHMLPPRRIRVFNRDGNRCLKCGTADDLSIDHVKPTSKGGANLISNMQTLCRGCNMQKGAREKDYRGANKINYIFIP